MSDKPKPLAPPNLNLPTVKLGSRGNPVATASRARSITRSAERAPMTGFRPRKGSPAEHYLKTQRLKQAAKKAAKKALVKKIVSKIAAPIAVAFAAHDVYRTGKAAHGAFRASQHAKRTREHAKEKYGTVERATRTRKERHAR